LYLKLKVQKTRALSRAHTYATLKSAQCRYRQAAGSCVFIFVPVQPQT